jgi:fructosamine-3-kinase
LSEQEIIQKILQEGLKKTGEINSIKHLSGGCIHHTVKVVCGKENLFVKWNDASFLEMFLTEARGLKVLKESKQIDIPEVYAVGSNNEHAYLVLPFIEQGLPSKNYWSDFGLCLSELHKHTRDGYGLAFVNFIGTLPQLNSNDESWIHFFIEKRLKPQITMAKDAGKLTEKHVGDFNLLIRKLPGILIEERPALLHGDLWSGNVLTSERGNVFLVDPAVYYGHREIEIAFTLLFGGFDEKFYASYFENYPVEKGFEERADIYNIYPLLVHLNLFGGGYLNQVLQVLKKHV